jgi:putative signal transducing protein
VKTVFTAESPAQAHLVAGLLEEVGIRSVVEGEALFGVRGDIGLTAASLPKVCVADGDAVRAVAILTEHEGRLSQERAAAARLHEDAEPKLTARRGLWTVFLWLLVLAAFVPLGTPALLIAIPVVGVCAYFHFVWLLQRDT